MNRKKAKPTRKKYVFADFSKAGNRYNFEESTQILKSLARETDRGLVLIATEWINDLLEQLLREQFAKEGADKSDVQDVLLSGVQAPIGTFAIRAKICRAFGLFHDPTVYEILMALKEIRNHCAHAKASVTLLDEDIADHVRAIEEFGENWKSPWRDVNSPENNATPQWIRQAVTEQLHRPYRLPANAGTRQKVIHGIRRIARTIERHIIDAHTFGLPSKYTLAYHVLRDQARAAQTKDESDANSRSSHEC